MSNEHNNAPAVQQGEPVAWKYELAVRINAEGRGSGWCWRLTDYKPSVPDGMIRNLRPLTYADAAPAVPQGEPVAAWLKAKIEKHALLAADCPGSSSVVLKSALLRFLDRLPPVAATPATPATPATAPAQERCSTCGYLTSEREHLGCLRRAVKDLDIATGGPYDAQGVGLTDAEIDRAVLEATGFDGFGIQPMNTHDTRNIGIEVIAALRAKALGMAVTYQVDAEMEHNNVPAVPQEEGRPGIPLRKAYKHLLIVAPAQELGLTDEEITQVCSGIYLSDHPQGSASYDVALARAIIAAHEAKQATPAPAPAQEIDKSVADAEIKAMYVESQGSEKGWLGIEGSYFIGGVVAARKQKAAKIKELIDAKA